MIYDFTLLLVIMVLFYQIYRMLLEIKGQNSELKTQVLGELSYKEILNKERNTFEQTTKDYQKILAQKEEDFKNNKEKSMEVKDLMMDLASGRALVKIERVNPTDYFLKSPRDL